MRAGIPYLGSTTEDAMRAAKNTDRAPREIMRYDSRSKEAVRAHLVPFWTARTPASFVERAQVWCFPGSTDRELDAYAVAAVPSAQIRAFEWNEHIADGIVERCTAQRRATRLYRGSLKDFLLDPAYADERCDWANLDYDGAAFSLADETRLVIERLRVDCMPRLAITSLVHRVRAALRESIVAASALAAVAPAMCRLGFDLALLANERMGLVAPREERAWYAIAREFGIALLLIEAFGKRTYGPSDDAAARTFRDAWDRAYAAHRAAVLADAEAALADGDRGIPQRASPALRACLEQRAIPLWIDAWLRFTYRPTVGSTLWTWMFRFDPCPQPIPLMTWIDQLLVQAPPLHVIDRTGRPIAARTQGLCVWCPH